MVQEPQPPEPTSKRQASDPFLNYAYQIAKGDAGNFVYCLEEDKFYIYEKGVWRQIYDTEFMFRISKAFTDITKFPLSQRKQVLENFKIIKYKHLNEFNWTQLLTLNNEMVHPLTGVSEAYDPFYFSTIKLDYAYSSVDKCELWVKTLTEIFEGDLKRIDTLQEFFGYCLVPDMEQKKALLLLGDSDTGKSTILFTLRDLIGQSNCSSVPLKYISNPQYTPMMVNKLVNIDADVDKNASNYEAEFKMVTSGEPINCNQKFVETFQFIPKCKIVLAANIFPKITDHSSAFYKRLILLPCDRIFEENEKDRFLAQKLKAELPGILNWAMEGLRRLKTRGRFEQYDFMKDAVQELEDENNPSNIFFEEHIEIDMASYVEKGDLYDKYKQWAERTKNYTLSSARFSSVVFKRFKKQTPKDTHDHNSRKRIWKNIKYVQFKMSEDKKEVQWEPPVVMAVNKEDTFWEA